MTAGTYGSSLSPGVLLEIPSPSGSARLEARHDADVEHHHELVDGREVASTLEDRLVLPDLGPTHDGLSGGTFLYAHGPRPASKERLL